MKIFSFILKKEESLRAVWTLGVFLVIFTVLASCEKSNETQVAEERFIVTNLAINATPELPLLIGRDSLLDISNGPENASNGELLWESSNPAIATVDDAGRVKALSVGEATIKVSSTDGGGRASSILVQVIDRIEYAIEIAIVPTSLSIFEAERATLAATIAPANATYKTLRWTSSNAAVATVSATGEVMGIAKGNAIITAATTDGSGVSKTVAVEIKEVIPVTAISISSVISESLAPGQTYPLLVDLMPSNATAQSLIWSSDNEAAVTVSESGVLTAVAEGQATITVSSKANADVKSSITVNVEAGKINDLFITGSNWKSVTANSIAVVEEGKFKVTMAVQNATPPVKYRGDFQRTGGATVHAGKFPIIAFKFNRPVGTGNVVFDTNNGSFLNGNNKLTTITGKDGVQIHYADISTGTFGGSAVKLSTTATTTLTTFQLKIADFVTTDNRYEVHWVKTFKTLTELQAYINQ